MSLEEPLGNFLELITYGFTNPMPDSKEGPWKITAKDIVKGRINYNTARKTTKQSFDNDLTPKSKPKIGDILLTKDGTLGRLAIVDKNNICVNQSVAILRPNSKITTDFLYYLLSSPYYQKKLLNDADGSVLKHIYITRVKKMGVEIPDLEKQSKICDIVGTIDKKIRINEQINHNLANFIDTNFKYQLLNFENFSEKDFINSEFGLIPKGWKVSNLTEIATYQNGLPMQKFPPENLEDSYKVLKIKELRQGFCDDSSDICTKNIKEECIVNDGDVIFSWSGSLLVDIWSGGTCGLNQHLFKVTSEDFNKWFYYCWTKFYLDQFILIAKDKATTMGHIKREHLKESLVLIPDKKTYSNLTKLFEPLFDLLIKNKIEIKKLQNLRDTLLPKLMSGEIDVSKVNCDLD